MSDTPGFQVGASAPDFYDEYVAVIMAPFVAAVVDAVDPAPGGAALDVACGTGFVTRALADRVGPTGRVAGADFNAEMLTKARAVSSGYPNVEFHEAPADAMPFGDADFSAVTCQQGFQFFPDVPAATKEIARLLAPGGRVAVTVWTAMSDAPYFEALYRALAAETGEEVLGYAPAFEAGSNPVADAFRAAGLSDVRSEELHPEIALDPVEEFAARHILGTPWAPIFLGLSDEAQVGVVSAVVADLAAYRSGTGVTVPFGSYLISATA